MKTKITLAAIAIAMSMPADASRIIEVAKSYGVDHKAVINELNEMLAAEIVAEQDMSNL